MNFFYFNHELFIRHMSGSSSNFIASFGYEDSLNQLYQLCKYPEKKQLDSTFIKQCEVVGEILITVPSNRTLYNPFSFFNSLPRSVKRSAWAKSFDVRGIENDPSAISFPHIFHIVETRIDKKYIEYMDDFHTACRQYVCDFFPLNDPAVDQHYVGIAFYQKSNNANLRYDKRKWKVRGEMLRDLKDILKTNHDQWDCWINMKYKGEKDIYENGMLSMLV